MTLKNFNINKDVLEQYKTILEDWIPNNASIAIASKRHVCIL